MALSSVKVIFTIPIPYYHIQRRDEAVVRGCRLGGGLLEDLVGPQEDGLRDPDAALLRHPPVDVQLEDVRRLDGEILRLGAPEDLP